MLNWSQICSEKLNRPLWQQQQSNYGGCLFAVGFAHSMIGMPPSDFTKLVLLIFLGQVVCFMLAAIHSGMWWLRWTKEGAKSKMWPQLGLFSGLMCAGCIAGAVSWIAEMQTTSFGYQSGVSNISPQESYSLLVLSNIWNAVYAVFYPFEVVLLIIAKLMMLRRLTEYATCAQNVHKGGVLVQFLAVGSSCNRLIWRAIPRVHRVLEYIILSCSLAGMVALFVSCAYALQAAHVGEQAVAACDTQGNDTNSSITLSSQASAIAITSATAESFQYLFEALTLLLISVTYAVLVPICTSTFRRAEEIASRALGLQSSDVGSNSGDNRPESVVAILDDTIHAAAEQRRNLLVACILVLSTFSLRASFDFINAYSGFFAPLSADCAVCDPCQTDRYLIQQWIEVTPEFQAIVVALSSPIPLSFSLWLMTSADTRVRSISFRISNLRS